MTNPFSPILNKDDAQLKDWLKDYLLGKSSYPRLPREHENPAGYLVSWYQNKREREKSIKLGDTAFALLRDIHENQEKQLSENSSSLLFDLLCLLKNLPTSNPREITFYLDKNFRQGRFYVKSPNVDDDIHSLILLAIANQIKFYQKEINEDYEREINEWIAKIEQEELKSYTVAASYILSRLSVDRAIEKLPNMLKLLNTQKIDYNNLLFDLACRIGDNPNQWKKVIRVLNDSYPDQYFYLQKLTRTLKYTQSEEVLNSHLGQFLQQLPHSIQKLVIEAQSCPKYSKERMLAKMRIQEELNKFNLYVVNNNYNLSEEIDREVYHEAIQQTLSKLKISITGASFSDSNKVLPWVDSNNSQQLEVFRSQYSHRLSA